MTSIQEQEERDFHVDSLADHCRAQAIIDNQGRSDHAWLCTDLDVWIRNPCYRGPPVPHPEDDREIEAYQADPAGWVAREIERRDAAPAGASGPSPDSEDPIPF